MEEKARALMKVLHIQPQAEFGGMPRITLDWIRHAEVQNVAVVGGSGPLREMLERCGCRVYSLRSWRPRNVWSLVPEVAAIVEREKIDLVHSSNCDGHLLGGLVRWKTRRPEIWFNHGPMERVAWSRFARFIPSDALLVASGEVERAQRRQGFWAKSISVHAPGVDCGRFSADATARAAARRRLGVGDELCVAMVARFDPGKGHGLLLTALSGVRRRRPDLRFKLVLVGGRIQSAAAHACEREVRRLAETLDLTSMTIFTGHVDNVTDYFNAADLHVVASTAPEAFGLALLEGMAMQKVTVAPAEGGPGEIVSHGEDGYLFPPRDSAALSAVLEKVMDELTRGAGRLASLGAAARRKVESRYGIVESTRGLERIYRRILATRTAGGNRVGGEFEVRT